MPSTTTTTTTNPRRTFTLSYGTVSTTTTPTPTSVTVGPSTPGSFSLPSWAVMSLAILVLSFCVVSWACACRRCCKILCCCGPNPFCCRRRKKKQPADVEAYLKLESAKLDLLTTQTFLLTQKLATSSSSSSSSSHTANVTNLSNNTGTTPLFAIHEVNEEASLKTTLLSPSLNVTKSIANVDPMMKEVTSHEKNKIKTGGQAQPPPFLQKHNETLKSNTPFFLKEETPSKLFSPAVMEVTTQVNTKPKKIKKKAWTPYASKSKLRF
ncbi:hypothetical protein HMI54_002560 [Coelomomyces lativittatus]|nr:hypothetical protein HMI54_002560 [Coelomomyces lativittatus]KAJ1510314.1 hypothetical protein HMI56_006394 [Coelomomyces lativittatus]